MNATRLKQGLKQYGMGRHKGLRKGTVDPQLAAKLFGGMTDLSIEDPDSFVDEKQQQMVASNDSVSRKNMVVLKRKDVAEALPVGLGTGAQLVTKDDATPSTTGLWHTSSSSAEAYQAVRSGIFHECVGAVGSSGAVSASPHLSQTSIASAVAPAGQPRRKVIMRNAPRGTGHDEHEFRR